MKARVRIPGQRFSQMVVVVGQTAVDPVLLVDSAGRQMRSMSPRNAEVLGRPSCLRATCASTRT